MKPGTLRTLSLVVILVGAMAMASPQLAFSAVEADRVSNLGIATDSNANLGVENKNDVAELRGGDPPQRVATLRNNVDQRLTIQSVVVDSINTTSASDLEVSTPPDGYELAPGDSVDVEVSCNSDVSVGDSTVTFQVARATGDTVEIRDVTWSVTINIQCNKGGGGGGGGDDPVAFTANDATAGNPDNTQTFEFDVSGLGNKEYAYIDLSNAQGNGIDYTGSDVTELEGNSHSELEYDAANERIVYQAQGNPSGTVTVEISGFTIDGNSGTAFTAYYTDDQGRSDSDGYQIG